MVWYGIMQCPFKKGVVEIRGCPQTLECDKLNYRVFLRKITKCFQKFEFYISGRFTVYLN